MFEVLRRYAIEAWAALHGASQIAFGRSDIAPLHRDISDIVEDGRHPLAGRRTRRFGIIALCRDCQAEVVLNRLAAGIEGDGLLQMADRFVGFSSKQARIAEIIESHRRFWVQGESLAVEIGCFLRLPL